MIKTILISVYSVSININKRSCRVTIIIILYHCLTSGSVKFNTETELTKIHIILVC